MQLESRPPERNTPTGTSAISRASVASWRRFHSSSASSASSRPSVWSGNSHFQKRRTRSAPFSYTALEPGGSLWMPENIVSGAGT